MTHKEYQKLKKQYFASEGVRQGNAFRSNQISWQTFDNNYRELANLISLYFTLSIEGKLGDYYNRLPLYNLLNEVTRLLHNFLASAKTLIDHTRCFVKRTYGESSIAMTEYQSEIKSRFWNAPVAKFTQELRNYFTHISMPFIDSVIGGSQSRGRDRYTLQLDTKKMQDADNWCVEARAYVLKRDKSVDLDLYVSEYYGLVRDFNSWLGSKVEEWSRIALVESDVLYSKLVEYERKHIAHQ